MAARCWPTTLRANVNFKQNEEEVFETVPIGTEWLFFCLREGLPGDGGAVDNSEDW